MNKRDKHGRWPVGTSGNPKGQPPHAAKVRALLEPHSEELVAKAVELALAGDAIALRICIDRLAPPPRAETAAVHVPGLAEAVTLTDKAARIIEAVGRGELSPDAGATLLSAIAAFGRVKEIDQLEQRVAALEQKEEL